MRESILSACLLRYDRKPKASSDENKRSDVGEEIDKLKWDLAMEKQTTNANMACDLM